MATSTRLGLVLEDDDQGARVTKVEEFAVIEGNSIHTGDIIMKINGLDAARSHWRNLLKCGMPNCPFQLQFWSQATRQMSSCVIYKQIVGTLPAKTNGQDTTNQVSCF
jgi:hypothetical protein